jgi:hypothetical protein
MKVLKAEHHAGRVEDGTRLCEDVGVDVHHEVPARRVLHHETHVALNKNQFRVAQWLLRVRFPPGTPPSRPSRMNYLPRRRSLHPAQEDRVPSKRSQTRGNYQMNKKSARNGTKLQIF